MIGSAVQLGLLAALIVILVPIMLAGWHLSRHKLLFFSGSLFVALAIAVHLSPYFPSLPDYLPNSKITPLIENRDSCLDLMNRIEWDVYGGDVGKSRVLSWRWDHDVGNCGFQRLKRGNVGELLNGSWVVVAGDSQARLFAVSLLELVLGEAEMGAVRGDLFKRHSDYGIVVDGVRMRLDFIWAPYEGNLTEVVAELTRNGSCPDVLVMGSGLWHMLHVTNSVDYGVSLRALSESVMSLLVPGSPFAVDGGGSGAVCARSQPHLFWLGMPMLINSMLNTEEKREKMSDVTRDAYDWRVRQSKLLRQSNGPFLLLDVRDLSKNCGVHCTEDGMHYYGIIYEAAVQIMLNALLIESRQKL